MPWVLISHSLFAANANSVECFNNKSLTLNSEFRAYVFKWLKTCSTSHMKLYLDVGGSKLEIPFMRVEIMVVSQSQLDLDCYDKLGLLTYMSSKSIL